PESEQVRTATPTGAGAGARPRHLRHRHVVLRATRGYRRPPRRDCCGTAVAGPPATRRFVPRLAFLLARRGPLAGWPGRKGPHTGRPLGVVRGVHVGTPARRADAGSRQERLGGPRHRPP